MKSQVGALNQENALVGAFSVIGDCKTLRNLRKGSFGALVARAMVVLLMERRGDGICWRWLGATQG